MDENDANDRERCPHPVAELLPSSPDVPDSAVGTTEAATSDTEVTAGVTTGGKTIYPYVPVESTSRDQRSDSARPTAGRRTVVPFPVEVSDDEDIIVASSTTGGKTVSTYADPLDFSQESEPPLYRPQSGGKTVSRIADIRQPTSESGIEERDVAFEQAIANSDDAVDIRLAMEDALSMDFECTSSFAFHRTYPDAPNPVLDIKGIGTIGLPLSLGDASAIKRQSSHASSDLDDPPVPPTSVQNTWEIDGRLVEICNHDWSQFLERTVKQICEVLGVKYEASQPHCELHKLLLYETGSHSPPRADTKKHGGTFATVVIVLPSKFAGGAVRVSHSGLADEYDCSSTSLTQTTVLAWYTAVLHEVKRVNSGYRLALSYNLIHTTSSLRPALDGQTKLIEDLRRVLLSWRKLGKGNGPQKLVYLLKDKYSEKDLRGTALKGADARKIELLNMLIPALGFHIGLASILCHERWPAHVERQMNGDQDVRMTEIKERHTTVRNLVDLNGNLLQKELDLELWTETIPGNLEDVLRQGEAETERWQEDHGKGVGVVDRFHRQTVCIIWPSWSHFDVIGFAYACEHITKCTSTNPTDEERGLVDVILTRAAGIQDRQQVMNSVCKVARRWQDIPLWFRAISKCDADSGIQAIREDNLLNAMDVFGFDVVRPVIENTLQKDTNNLSALKFLDRVESWLNAPGDMANAQSVPPDWPFKWRMKLLESLKPCGEDETQYLIDISLRVGSIDFLERNLLPQIQHSAAPKTMLKCATYIHGLSRLPPQVKTRLVHDTIETAISKSDYYGPDKEALDNVTPDSSSANARASITYATLCITTCRKTGCEKLVAQVTKKLTDMSGIPPAIARQRAKDVLLPLISLLADEVYGRPMVQGIQKLCNVGCALYLDWIAASPAILEQEHVSALFQAAITGRVPKLVLDVFIPRLETLNLRANVIRDIVQELRAKRESLNLTKRAEVSFDDALVRLVKQYAAVVDLSPRPRTNPYIHPSLKPQGPPAPAADFVMHALEFCIRSRVPEACCDVVSRMVHGPIDQRDSGLFFILIPKITSLLDKYVGSTSSPIYSSIFRMMMNCWVDKILGPPPPSDQRRAALEGLRWWACDCEHCGQVRGFLHEGMERTKSWENLDRSAREHLEHELKDWCGNVASWKLIYGCGARGIKVTKVDALYEPTRWENAQEDGRSLLQSINTSRRELQIILGEDFQAITSALHMVYYSGPGAVDDPPTPVRSPRSLTSNGTPGPSHGPMFDTVSSDDDPTSTRPTKRRKMAHGDREVIDLT